MVYEPPAGIQGNLRLAQTPIVGLRFPQRTCIVYRRFVEELEFVRARLQPCRPISSSKKTGPSGPEGNSLSG